SFWLVLRHDQRAVAQQKKSTRIDVTDLARFRHAALFAGSAAPPPGIIWRCSSLYAQITRECPGVAYLLALIVLLLRAHGTFVLTNLLSPEALSILRRCLRSHWPGRHKEKSQDRRQ